MTRSHHHPESARIQQLHQIVLVQLGVLVMFVRVGLVMMEDPVRSVYPRIVMTALEVEYAHQEAVTSTLPRSPPLLVTAVRPLP